MAGRTTGLKTIAYSLGLSINTVSRALRDCDDISEKTKELVRKKAYELGYMPGTVARYIKRDDKKLVAIIISDLKNLYFGTMCQRLAIVLNANNYDFTIISTFKDQLDDDVVKQCISQRVDAILSLIKCTDKAVEACKMNEIVLTLIGHRPDENDKYCDAIYSDQVQGIDVVANYLVNYHKIKKIAFVGNSRVSLSVDREHLFKEDLSNINSEIDYVYLDINDPNTVTVILKEKYFGVFCYNDETAYLLLQEMNDLFPNVRKIYPKLHIVGYDALSTRVVGTIDLTSVSWDYDDMIEQTIKLLNSRLENIQDKRKKIKLPVRLHQRKYY
jgi:LacI family transcriptional regulator